MELINKLTNGLLWYRDINQFTLFLGFYTFTLIATFPLRSIGLFDSRAYT